MVSLQTRIILDMIFRAMTPSKQEILKNTKIWVLRKLLKYEDYENVHNRTGNRDKKTEIKNRWMRKSRKSRNCTEHIDAEVCNDTEEGPRNLRRLDITQSLVNTVKIWCEQKCMEMTIIVKKNGTSIYRSQQAKNVQVNLVWGTTFFTDEYLESNRPEITFAHNSSRKWILIEFALPIDEETRFTFWPNNRFIRGWRRSGSLFSIFSYLVVRLGIFNILWLNS